MACSEYASSSVIVIDALPLRGACVAALIEPWVQSVGHNLRLVDAADLARDSTDLLEAAFIIVSIGSDSVHDDDVARIIRLVIEHQGERPTAILSDRTDPDDVLHAAQLGFKAFLPTNLSPNLALQTLTFILGGGSYFPREALLYSAPRDVAGLRIDRPVPVEPNQFTRRQREVLERLRQGRSNKNIGRDLNMQESTVKVHVRQIMRKLGAANRTQAALYAGNLDFILHADHVDPDHLAQSPDQLDQMQC